MAKKLTQQDVQTLVNYVNQADHHEIYRIHMLQAKQTRKMFANDPAMLDKIKSIEEKIKETYRQACEKEQA